MTRRFSLTRRRRPLHATCTRTSRYLYPLRLRLSSARLLRSSMGRRSNDTGCQPSLECGCSQAPISSNSLRSRPTSRKGSASRSSALLPMSLIPTHPLSRSTPTTSALVYSSTCSSVQSSSCPPTRISQTTVSASSPYMSSSRQARSHVSSSTCLVTSTTICSTSISHTAAWTTRSRPHTRTAGTANSTCPTASCRSLCIRPSESISVFGSTASCISSHTCLSASARRHASALNSCQLSTSRCQSSASRTSDTSTTSS